MSKYRKRSYHLRSIVTYIFLSRETSGKCTYLKYFHLPSVGFQLLGLQKLFLANNHPISGYFKTIVRVCQVSKYLLQSTPTTNSFSVTVCFLIYQHTVVLFTYEFLGKSNG